VGVDPVPPRRSILRNCVEKTKKRNAEFLAGSVAGARDDLMSAKNGAFPDLDVQLMACFHAVRACFRKRFWRVANECSELQNANSKSQQTSFQFQQLSALSNECDWQ